MTQGCRCFPMMAQVPRLPLGPSRIAGLRVPGRARRAVLVGLMALAVPAALNACGSDDAAGGEPLAVDRVLGETGRQPGQFTYPRGIATFELDGRRTLAVVDKTARIQLIDERTGEPLGVIRTPAYDLGMPTGLTVAAHPSDPSRRALWVADTHEHRVIIYPLPFDAAGASLEPDLAFGTYGYAPGEFVYPTDIAVINDASGAPARVFVSEYGGNDRISEFSVARAEDGAVSFSFVRQIGYSGVAMDAPEDDPAALSRPQSIALRRGDTELVVTDVGRHRVVRFDVASGDVIGWTDGSTMADGSATDAVVFPYGLELLGDDLAVVCEFGASRLRVIDLDSGRTVSLPGVPGRGVGQLATPWACVVSGDELVVLDSGNDRIQVLPLSRLAGSGGAR